MVILTVILIVMALAAIAVLGRFFCRWICPMGYFLKLANRIGPNKIHIDCSKASLDAGQCTGCLKCVRACPMGAIKYLPKHPRLTPEFKNSLSSNLPRQISCDRPLVMGILNLSHDSFYPDSIASPDKFLATFEELLCDGAEIIDIGACSSRPGATAVDVEEQWKLLEKPLRKIAKKYPGLPLVSLDTTEPEIVRRALRILDNKRLIVNDIAGADNGEMLTLCAREGVQYVITYNNTRSFASHQDDVDGLRHSKGSNATEESHHHSEADGLRHSEGSTATEESCVAPDPSLRYTSHQDDADGIRHSEPVLRHSEGSTATEESCVAPDPSLRYTPHQDDIVAYFDAFAEKAKKLGLKDYIIDPGLGFGGKSIEDNYQILSNLEALKKYNRPILVGLSRKSMIYKYLGISAKDSLEATTALDLFALQHGATIIRVHDPAQGVQAVKLHKMLLAK